MIKSTFLIAIIALLISYTVSDLGNAEADWVDPLDLGLNFTPEYFFAGYLKVNSNQKFFYTYYPSQNNARKDPVVVWFGSGPGCSALYSNFYSKGPFILTKNTKQFRTNPYAWNRRANLVFIESPGTVGFSSGEANITDTELATKHLYALISFFDKFVGLKDQDLYLAGEGYAGIYIPFLANRITEHNKADLTLPEQRILLKGLFLGNPCTNPKECHLHEEYNEYSYEYLYNHYYYTADQWTKYKDCILVDNEQCKIIRRDMDQRFDVTGVDRRNIFSDCLEQNTQGYPNIPCLDQIGVLTFLNKPAIQKAIHAEIAEGNKWLICNDTVKKGFIRDSRGSVHLYPSLLSNYRITVYSGALDAANPISGTVQWIEELRDHNGYASTKQWIAWNMDGVNGGEVWKINQNRLTFVSIRSAGHLVFTDQPELGYHVYESFLNNTM